MSSFPEDPLDRRTPEERDLDHQTWISIWYLYFALFAVIGVLVLVAAIAEDNKKKRDRGVTPPAKVAPAEEREDRP